METVAGIGRLAIGADASSTAVAVADAAEIEGVCEFPADRIHGNTR